MQTDPVDFTTPTSRAVRGALALPPGTEPAPAVIVVHEWWGLNDDMRRIAGRFAEEGFVALVVDLYDGRVTDRSEEAMALAQTMQTPAAMDVVRGAVAFLAAHPRCTGEVGVTGFCLGGAMALAAACQVTGLGAAVPFYGIPLPKYADYTQVKVPIQGHYGRTDPIIPVEKPAAVEAAVRAAGGEAELFLYDAGHAFMRERDPTAYVPEAARVAWDRTIAFFREKLRKRAPRAG